VSSIDEGGFTHTDILVSADNDVASNATEVEVVPISTSKRYVGAFYKSAVLIVFVNFAPDYSAITTNAVGESVSVAHNTSANTQVNGTTSSTAPLHQATLGFLLGHLKVTRGASDGQGELN